ncbi:Testis-specific zinc finger protein topi-like [Homarus americanus]|uniref:Testis-specific zinc finger protein topi-like n=2 Tax=Homarus americanus TaxID=6706 RepID=A0A8J5N348_HOMAM|nr:Testis-specific zinc finger protein topi-like [Homarus americanus]
MSGGRRKSRKPQKWEDYVADEEQLATIEKELEKEEKARMKNAENDGDLTEKSPDDAAQNEEDEEMTDYDDDAAQLEIILGEDEEEEKLHDFKTELDKEGTQEEEEEGEEKYKEEKPQLINIPGTGQVIGDCTTCSIQLRDWNSVHSHLRFHRLSHVPECSYKLVSALSKRINCQVCHRCCQNREVLAYHAYTEHYISCKDSKICPFCSTNFKDMDEFQEHLDIDVISFKCQICGITISINNLYNHLMQHSTLLSLPRHLANNNRRRAVNPSKPDPPRQQQTRYRPFLCEICDHRFVVYSEFKRHLYSHSKSRSYVCTHCGRGYCQKNTLIVHLYSYHNSSPNAEENTPKEDTAQRCCELCGRSGFLNDELLIRHCILRCSQRNNLQVSFAVIVSSLAKNQNLGFSETVRSSALQTYLKLGIEAWGSPLCCINFIAESHNELSQNCVRSCWKKLWPEIVPTFTGFPTAEPQLRNIITMANEVGGEGFSDLTAAEVQEELLGNVGDPFTSDELEQLVELQDETDDEVSDDENKNLTLDNLGEVIRMSKALSARLYDIDPSLDRSLKAKRAIENVMLPYIELQREMRSKKAQTTITNFFSRRVPAIAEPADTSQQQDVKQFLEELQSNQPPTPSSGHRWDSAECTDVQLLAYLDQFDEKNREQDRELEFLLDMKSKDVSGSQMEGLSMMENLSSLNPVDRKSEFSDKITLGPVDVVTSSPCTNGDPETPSKNTAGWTNSQVDLSSLMQHLRRGTDKRRADEEGGGGGPIDICLVTSTTNTQVTITPAGCQPHGIRPPKVARSVSHRPSVSQIRSIYPGVTLLRDVDFSRVPSVILQMQEMMSYSVQKEMEEADISPSDLQRLEVEAQFLREAEPFYLRDDPQWQLPKCSSRIMNRSSNKKCNTIPDPATLTRIIAEAGVVYDAGRNIVLDDPNAMKCPGKAHIARLLQETQKFFFV